MNDRTAAPPTTDEIAAAWNNMSRAWEAGSGQDFAASFAPDAHFVAFDGTILHSAGEIAAFHQRAFDAPLKGTRLVTKIEATKTLGNVVLVFASGAIERDGAKTGDLIGDSVQTAVVARNDSGIHIEAFQNTRSRPITDESSASVWKDFDRAWNAKTTG
jgi:uncharacterized protein (TIGR02246 family)